MACLIPICSVALTTLFSALRLHLPSATLSERTIPNGTSDASSRNVPPGTIPSAKGIPKSSFSRGYSSGASSYEGSDLDEGEASKGAMDRSSHSNILGLQGLRQEMLTEGGTYMANQGRVDPSTPLESVSVSHTCTVAY